MGWRLFVAELEEPYIDAAMVFSVIAGVAIFLALLSGWPLIWMAAIICSFMTVALYAIGGLAHVIGKF